MSTLECITPDWPAPATIRAAVTTRVGGVSGAPYGSLNLASHVGDAMAAVQENRERLQRHLSLPEQPLWLTQVHGVDVLRRDGASVVDLSKSYDACYSNQPNTVCAVLTADCLPVLFCSCDGKEIAAAHAGWRGLAEGVLPATVRQFSCQPAEIQAWLGPAIGANSFAVGDDVRTQFIQQWSSVDERAVTDCFIKKDETHWLCDLYALARWQLQALAIGKVYGGGEDTLANAQRFYSYRRDGDTGRMASLVWRTS